MKNRFKLRKDLSIAEQVSKNGEDTLCFLRRAEAEEWWLWVSVVLVTLFLTLGIASFLLPSRVSQLDAWYLQNLSLATRGLLGAVLLFDIYTVYQKLQIYRIRRQLIEQGELFRLINKSVADMVTVVDKQGQRLYCSPSHLRVLGYAPQELAGACAFDEIHPDDRALVVQATAEARRGGAGKTMEYRTRHKDGSWRMVESTVSVMLDGQGDTDQLVIVNRDITARKRAEERLVHNTFHDVLTNLPNRALFIDRVQRAFSHGQRHPEYKFAVLFIDVDDFKMFNDSFGHAVGDELIIEMGRRLKKSLRSDDTVSRLIEDNPRDDTLARLGGDEFAVLLNDIRQPSDVIRVADRIQKIFASPFALHSQELFASASIGIALSTTPRASAADLLRDADIAMYRAKAMGKARFEVFDVDMHARAVQRLKLETDLRRGVERGEFRIFYQPIVCLATGRIVGMESLVRWEHPELGLLSPANFICVAEETGLLTVINKWLLPESCRQMQLWHANHTLEPPLTIASNLSPKHFSQADLVTDVHNILRETGMNPHCLQLEMTESVAMDEGNGTNQIVQQLKALGIRLSIDDFGTGYSSLSRLRRLPVDTVKIDRSFVSNLEAEPDNREIIRAIITLAHQLGLEVVAEGTETLEQVTFLQQLGCEFAQGYFFSQPVPPDSIDRLLAQQFCFRIERTTAKKEVSLRGNNSQLSCPQ